MDHVRVLRQISVVAALFYLDNSRKIHLRGVRACQLKDAKRRVPQREGVERERARAHARGREGVHACGGVGKRERESTHAHVGERARMHAWERERVCTWGRERERKRFGSSFYMFFPPPGPAPCKLGLARSAVCPTWGLHSGPQTFFWPSFVLFARASPFLVFEPQPLWTPFPYSNYLTWPRWTSLVAQWLRFCAPKPWGIGSTPG